ncbi:MAG: DUF2304 domain-containing protein [Verrucomicrobia bacterium]|nr:DUF2304 domain-containing protein [Verrucomicrobiota bacterium]
MIPEAVVASVNTFRAVSITISVLFMLAVIEFIRRNRLKERYAILWLGAGTALVVLSVWGTLLVEVTRLLGFDLPSNALSLVILFFLIVIVFHFSIAISMESERTKRLAQEVALLKERLRCEAPDIPPDAPSEP